MCMSTAYERKNGENVLVCENVREARTVGRQVTLIDILGYAVTVEGTIKEVDLVKNAMFIEAV